jgi:hypothetical protein
MPSDILARTAERRAVQQADYRAATGDLQELASITALVRHVTEHFERRDTQVKPRGRRLFLALLYGPAARCKPKVNDLVVVGLDMLAAPTTILPSTSTGRALGLTVAPTLLACTDEAIE